MREATIRPQFLEGTYVGELKSPKGKLKGIRLQTARQEYPIKLPKYLVPILTHELESGSPMRVWVTPKKDTWIALNIIPLSPKELAAESLPIATPSLAQPSKPYCVQVCSKSNCCKRGSSEVYRAMEDAIATNPSLSNIRLEPTGCLKECKKGPCIRLASTGKVFTQVTCENAPAILAEHGPRPQVLR
ncbi:(2Fe-2S) ferredoxin domain-containing protein [Pseudanabaena sp. FACHB-2040]|uniref:(2Fe-2S) ferredoxin domain-containing protein n=1 Tax=Pseudanabaena sp. FACHB-2040 TaxID=2692859 RepID=UPI0016827E77|nr:(2Fe-2S) ferredoxin domain-containing protein [Pseudanabaena sp. FACHB-2040]MBD2257085.1 (2Fe-2S) ferredoxin domain-containing protein [Pseudanabaena sp. FACHB-2040]